MAKAKTISNPEITLGKFFTGRPSSKAVETILNQRSNGNGIHLTDSEVRSILTSDVTNLGEVNKDYGVAQLPSWRKFAGIVPLNGSGNPLVFTALPEAQVLGEGVSYTGVDGTLEEYPIQYNRIQAMAEWSELLAARGQGDMATLMGAGLVRSLDAKLEQFIFDFHAGTPATAFNAGEAVEAAMRFDNPIIVSSKGADIRAIAKEAKDCGMNFEFALVQNATTGGTIVAEKGALKLGVYGEAPYQFESDSMLKAEDGISIVKASARVAGIKANADEVVTFALSA